MKNETKQLSVLHDLSRAIVGASKMEDVCQRILARTAKLLNVSKASIMKLDPGEGTLKIVASCGLPKNVASEARVKVGHGISGRVFKSRKPVLIKDIKAAGLETRKRYKSKSLMSAPVTCFSMKVAGKPIGVINVTDKKGGRPFTPDDMQLLNTIANQTASYIHLCDLAEESRNAEHMRRELELARTIQQRLLPAKLPQVKGFDIAGACLTADRVGGDYFDILTGGARPPSIVVADVAGHSVSAAMMMSAFRSALRSDAPATLYSPAIVAERLNAVLYEDLVAAEQFISMIYLQILRGAESKGAVIKYTTAGHHAPLILQGGGFISHSTEDVLLGVEAYPEYHDRRIDVSKGDVVTLYTDGLIEASDIRGKRFGLERLKTLIKAHRNGSAENMLSAIVSEVRSFAGKKSLPDDVTVVIVKVQ